MRRGVNTPGNRNSIVWLFILGITLQPATNPLNATFIQLAFLHLVYLPIKRVCQMPCRSTDKCQQRFHISLYVNLLHYTSSAVGTPLGTRKDKVFRLSYWTNKYVFLQGDYLSKVLSKCCLVNSRQVWSSTEDTYGWIQWHLGFLYKLCHH